MAVIPQILLKLPKITLKLDTMANINLLKYTGWMKSYGLGSLLRYNHGQKLKYQVKTKMATKIR